MRLYVGNLAFDAENGHLFEAFGKFGKVDQAEVVRDRETFRSRGFAFVTMPNDEQAAAAIEGMNGQLICERRVNVTEAHARGGGRR